jgi:Fe2+ or Zn2+ uptake regulation protein
MELSELEKCILESFDGYGIMTLKMIAKEVNTRLPGVSKQSVWNALQLLVARNMVMKIERGVYRRA